MLKHIVLFQLAEEAEGNSKAENAAIIKQLLEALKDSIPEIVKMEVSINHPDAPAGNYDIVLESEFKNLTDLQTYTSHPRHLKAAEFIGKVRTARAAIDYEI
ncbi:MAG: Dabb family protein [Bacteroidia bacterium]|nr:Dabb family protein [Bacteroidia bacterium]